MEVRPLEKLQVCSSAALLQVRESWVATEEGLLPDRINVLDQITMDKDL